MARVRASKILTVQEVSNYLRVHPSTIYKLLKRHELPAFRIGGSWRFIDTDIDKWLARIETGFTATPVQPDAMKPLK